MTNLKTINQLLQDEIYFHYKFNVGEIYFNSLENDSNTYESFFVKCKDMENSNTIGFTHVTGKLFEISLNYHESTRYLEASPALFEAMRQYCIKGLVKLQIERYETLINDTQSRINELAESLAYYNKERNKSIDLLEKLEGEN